MEETTGRGSAAFVKNLKLGEMSVQEEVSKNICDSSVFGSIVLRVPRSSTTEQRKHLLEEFYRRELKVVIPDLMEKYVLIVGKSPTEWRIRNMKTKWGTCNVVDKRIWLSLNLAKKHPDCLEYVIAHELTHLHEPNHGKAFWARMDVYYPKWKEVRKLLNER